ncbi:MAG: hypothetical protein JNL87_02120 [Burkholderiaceae bacterium]|nr:hypothetical protein [Burkholderiaceae bacterium]
MAATKESHSMTVMQRTRVLALAVGTVLAAPVLAADLGVSVSISQPGVYGRIDIGRFPQPQVVMQAPVWVVPARVMAVPPAPLYLWVPPGHRRHWSHHCRQYNACAAPVYFVQDGWYRRNVVVAGPRPSHRHGGRHGHRHDD